MTFRCERLACTLSVTACAIRSKGSRERFPWPFLLACKGCPQGVEHEALVSVTLRQDRKGAAFRRYNQRPVAPAPLRPDFGGVR